MPRPRKITQRATLALVRKPMPPRGRVILDKIARLRRKRKSDQFWLDSQSDTLS